MKIRTLNKSPERREAILKQSILCYAERCGEQWGEDDLLLYFTTGNLQTQWGDDWNDIPYEHNAGTPYVALGVEEDLWEITTVAINLPGVLLPHEVEDTANSSLSVEHINAGHEPWLTYKSDRGVQYLVLYAGSTYAEFVKWVERVNNLRELDERVTHTCDACGAVLE